MAPCMASHLPPPLKAGGGASATAFTTASSFALTVSGQASRKSRAGTVRAGSSSGWRWKKWMRQGWAYFGWGRAANSRRVNGGRR